MNAHAVGLLGVPLDVVLEILGRDAFNHLLQFLLDSRGVVERDGHRRGEGAVFRRAAQHRRTVHLARLHRANQTLKQLVHDSLHRRERVVVRFLLQGFEPGNRAGLHLGNVERQAKLNPGSGVRPDDSREPVRARLHSKDHLVERRTFDRRDGEFRREIAGDHVEVHP